MKTDVKKLAVGGREIIKRRHRFCYTHMEDGVHPDDFLRTKWFRVLTNSISHDIERYFSVPVRVSVEVNLPSDDEPL